MLGVWIAPVTAQLMITLPAMVFLPHRSGLPICIAVGQWTRGHGRAPRRGRGASPKITAVMLCLWCSTGRLGGRDAQVDVPRGNSGVDVVVYPCH